MKLFLCILALVASTMSDSNLEETLKAANDQFTAGMFQEVVKAQGDKSVVLSAYSVLSPLAQLALASVGASHDEILKTIGFPNDNVTREVFIEANAGLRAVKGVELKLANKVYVREGWALNDDFAAMSKQVFNSEVQNIKFIEQIKAAQEMNSWVEDHTNKRIKDLVDPASLDGNTAAVLLNAIYFKGQWKKPFNKEATKDRDFHVNKDNKITVPMMSITDTYKYGESKELDAKLLEMPYNGDETSLVVVLPNTIDGINDLIQKFTVPAVINKALDNMYSHEVEVSIPKFKIETTTNLRNILKKMNIDKLFNAGEARLDNLIKGVNDLFISSATQKAFIEVNEEGAEAAAANDFTVSRAEKMVPLDFEFKADRPFYFALKYNNVVLFNGIFRS